MNIVKRKNIKFLIIPVLVLSAVSLHFKRIHELDQVPTATAYPWALHTAEVRTATVHQGFPALGTVVSATDLRISPQITGTVLNMGPRAGGKVKKGDMLVHLDTRELEANLAALQAELRSAEATRKHDARELQRERELMKHGGSSSSEVEQRLTRLQADEAHVHALKENIKALKVKISYGHITAPTDAAIAERLAEPGDTVFPGKPVYVLSASQGGRVIVPIPLDTMMNIQPNGKVILSLGRQKMTVAISRINPALDKLSMGSIEIDLPARPFNLPDGARISARVIRQQAENQLVIPHDALLPGEGSRRAVFKLVQGTHGPVLHRVPVDIVLCGDEGCAVRGDIKAGDRVVNAHESVLLKLHENDPVMAIAQGGAS